MTDTRGWTPPTRLFVSKPSDSYRATIAQLKALMAAEGTDTVSRAYAAAVWDTYAKHYAVAYGLERAASACLHRLLHRGPCRSRDRGGLPCRLPGADHDSLWRVGRDALLYVSQPYGLSWESLQEAEAVCRRYGFEMQIETYPSWHFPGHVLTVEVATIEGWKTLHERWAQRGSRTQHTG
jgi:hypothetical protein